MEEHSRVPVSLTLHLVVNQDDRASSVFGKNDIQRLLLHRLMVLEVSIQKLGDQHGETMLQNKGLEPSRLRHSQSAARKASEFRDS
jgi:hypothetical protein